MLSKRKSEREDLENSQPIPIAINDKACSAEIPRTQSTISAEAGIETAWSRRAFLSDGLDPCV